MCRGCRHPADTWRCHKIRISKRFIHARCMIHLKLAAVQAGRGAHWQVFDVLDPAAVLGCKQVCNSATSLVVKVSHGAGLACMDVSLVCRYHGTCEVEGGATGAHSGQGSGGSRG